MLSSGQLVLRRIHALECLRLQGWDMSMWSEPAPTIRALGGPWGQEELQGLVGNMSVKESCPYVPCHVDSHHHAMQAWTGALSGAIWACHELLSCRNNANIVKQDRVHRHTTSHVQV